MVMALASLVFMNGDRCALARPGKDPTELWTISVLAGPTDPGPGHGLGIGDVNLDGRNDVLIPNGWWEQPAQAAAGTLAISCRRAVWRRANVRQRSRRRR